MVKTAQHTKAIRFRNFMRKGYAIFCSLGKEITIGRIAGYITNLSLQKSQEPQKIELPYSLYSEEDDERDILRVENNHAIACAVLMVQLNTTLAPAKQIDITYCFTLYRDFRASA